MKKIVVILLVIALFAGAAYWYVFHKPHRDIANEVASLQVTADQLHQDFISNPDEARVKYIDQIVEVNGSLQEILETENGIILAPGIYGSVKTLPQIELGQIITIRGRVLSFDDLMEEVKMDFVQVLP